MNCTKSSIRIKLATIFSLISVVLPTLVIANNRVISPKPLTEDQKIIHVLNRLGFGARPGDLEKVRQMGLQKYIEQQLNASAIGDSAVENRVKKYEVFAMTTSDVFAKYPAPNPLLRQLEGGRRNAAANGTPSPPAVPKANGDPDRDEQRERREKRDEIYREYNLRQPAQINSQIIANRFVRAAYSERQLQEVMVDFWQNHFNVFLGKSAVRWYIPSYERDVLRKNALGNFRELVAGTAQHPAMLFYLDNFESKSPTAVQKAAIGERPNASASRRYRERIKKQRGFSDEQFDAFLKRREANQRRRQQVGLNENYARELMELHTLGVDGGYTQKDIVEVAKAFSGWTIADPRGYRRIAGDAIKGNEDQGLNRMRRQTSVPDDVESGEFYFNSKWHDNGPKTILGHKVDEGGIKDGLAVIDILVKHRSTAKFIARKLAVKFVSDTPDETFVGRIADAFTNSNGDIKTTLRAIFTSKEFFYPENYRAKIKTPFELAVSSVRALNAETNASPAMLAMLNKLGEIPYGYQAPTGYPDTAEDWVNTGALLERLNFAVAVSSNRIPGTSVDLGQFEAESSDIILDRVIATVLSGEVSAATKATLKQQLSQPLPEVTPGDEISDMADAEQAASGKGRMNRRARLLQPRGDPEIFKAVSLVLGAPEFQRQ
ncbi:MAG: DUF1800 family protein [Pyrinomonadaceae bacterium]